MGYPTLRSLGTSAKPLLSSKTNHKFDEIRAKTIAGAGDTRLVYHELNFGGAGAGETYRIRSLVSGAQGSGQTTNAAHITQQYKSGGTISGAGNTLRLTMGIDGSVTPGGTKAVLRLDSDIGASAEPGTAAFLAVGKAGSVDLPTFISIEDDQCLKGNGTLGAITSGDALTVKGPAGQVWYIPLVAAG